MNAVKNGSLTLLEIPDGAKKDALIHYLARCRKSVSREKLTELVENLPLVLSRDISEEGARRLAAEMSRLGAKLSFRPHGLPEEETKSTQAAPATSSDRFPDRFLDEALVNGAFLRERIHFPVSSSYRLGLLLVSSAMILLPLLYCALVGGVAYLLYWHATTHLHVFQSTGSLRGALFMYLMPMIIGGLVMLFLVKPLFARRAAPQFNYRLFPRDEPLFFAFLEKVCGAVGVPMPSSVRLDTQVNASAGFARGIRSFRGHDLELTIGLPLVRGLTVSEFAGVLAHELGHFAQSSGMRMSYIVRSINHWFGRVVYEEDVYDVRLRVLSQSAGIQVGIILGITRFLIWIGRRVLFLLMKVGHLISCFMLRQMEYDADRYETALVGADVFESTCQKLRQLAAAHSMAFQDLDRHWEEGRLVDSIPELVGLSLLRMEEETRGAISRAQAESRTGLFDTHPADPDRIAAARAVTHAPVFSWRPLRSMGAPEASPAPSEIATKRPEQCPGAVVLFKDFAALSKKVTSEHYRQVLNCAPGSRSLVEAHSLLESRREERESGAALGRYFRGKFSPWIPLGIDADKLAAPTDPAQAVKEILELRERILVYDHRHEELMRELIHLHELVDKSAGALALLDSGFTINAGSFSLPGGAMGDVVDAEKRYAQREKALLNELTEIGGAYVGRLMLGLELLRGMSEEGGTGDMDGVLRGIEPSLQAMEALERQFPLVRKLRRDFHGLIVLADQIPKSSNNELLRDTIQERMDAVRQDLGSLRRNLSTDSYPLDHARSDMTLGLFLVDTNTENCSLAELLQSADRAMDRMLRTYSRLAARLARAAEAVEKSHGMTPLQS